MRSAQVAIIGAGAAGLALATRLGEQGTADVVLVDAPPGPLRPPQRTWCSWQSGPGYWADAVSASWSTVAVVDHAGTSRHYDLAPLTYTMIRSGDYERVAAERLAATAVTRLEATVSGIVDGTDSARVDGADLQARWVFDTRPTPPPVPGRTTLQQHFRGWFVRSGTDVFDPAVAGLMDFRPEQPPGGVAFGYVLPTGAREALVEYTEFSRELLTTGQYEEKLHSYVAEALGLPDLAVVGSEQGAIPMTDAHFPRRVSDHVLRLGGAGGATRPSTGFTFTAIQRQAAHVAAALHDGRDPTPPPAYARRHLWMDALLLRGLDGGTVDGAGFFVQLFARQPTERVLRFLDGTTSRTEDLAVMAAAPRRAMVRTALRSR